MSNFYKYFTTAILCIVYVNADTTLISITKKECFDSSSKTKYIYGYKCSLCGKVYDNRPHVCEICDNKQFYTVHVGKKEE